MELIGFSSKCTELHGLVEVEYIISDSLNNL